MGTPGNGKDTRVFVFTRTESRAYFLVTCLSFLIQFGIFPLPSLLFVLWFSSAVDQPVRSTADPPQSQLSEARLLREKERKEMINKGSILIMGRIEHLVE